MVRWGLFCCEKFSQPNCVFLGLRIYTGKTVFTSESTVWVPTVGLHGSFSSTSRSHLVLKPCFSAFSRSKKLLYEISTSEINYLITFTQIKEKCYAIRPVFQEFLMLVRKLTFKFGALLHCKLYLVVALQIFGQSD